MRNDFELPTFDKCKMLQVMFNFDNQPTQQADKTKKKIIYLDKFLLIHI